MTAASIKRLQRDQTVSDPLKAATPLQLATGTARICAPFISCLPLTGTLASASASGRFQMTPFPKVLHARA